MLDLGVPAAGPASCMTAFGPDQSTVATIRTNLTLILHDLK